MDINGQVPSQPQPDQRQDAGTSQTHDLDLTYAKHGADLINCGALLEGLRTWADVGEWGTEEIDLVLRAVDPDRLVNAIAEYRYGAFGPENLDQAVLAAGAVLGRRAGEAAGYYGRAGKFLTRVVGCGHDGRLEWIEDVQPGERVALVWEPDNPHDANAIKVMTRARKTLGYVRRTIARQLAPRLQRGAALQAKVALVLSNKFGPMTGYTWTSR